MLGLCLGEEAFGKGLAAKREQHQTDIELEWMVATQTWVGGVGGGGDYGVAGRAQDAATWKGLRQDHSSQSRVPTAHSYLPSHRVLKRLFLAHLKFGQKE